MVVLDKVEVTGRGMVLIISLQENHIQMSDLGIGQEVRYLGIDYVINGIEAHRTLMTREQVKDNVGLLVTRKLRE